MRPVPDKPIRLGGGSETVPDGWHVVYQCPSCRRYFDSPSVCSDGAEAVPRLERVPRTAGRDWDNHVR